MRILYLNADPGVPVLGHKGASVHVRELTRALARRGAEVVVAAPRIAPEGDTLDDAATLAAIAPVLPTRLLDASAVREAMAAQEAQVVALVREQRIDAVYERFSLLSDAGTRAAARAGVPHVLEVNAPLREEALRFRTLPHAELAETVECSVLTATSRVLAVSEPVAAHVIALCADATAVEVLPNGVRTDVPLAVPGADPATFTVGFAGSLKPWHGVEVLVEAVARVADVVDGLRVEVAGHGPVAEALATAPLPEGRLRMLGALPHREVLERMATWDVGAAPYLPMEDFYFSPLKVLEYMAARLCTVASALGDLPALLGYGSRGVLVAPGDAADLARALVTLAGDPAGAARRGAAAREHVVEHRGWDVNAERVLDALGAVEVRA